MTHIVFVHGMFQNPKSWQHWLDYFNARGFTASAPAWPLHEGDPKALRDNPPSELGELSLDTIYDSIEREVAGLDRPVVIGHSVGGLIVQKLLARGLVSGAVAISTVAPNAMLDFDWGFVKNSAIITNPFKGDEPVFMDAETFHGSFANTLSKEEAAAAFENTATHDSRNVLRDCMGSSGRIDLERPHAPLLFVAGEKDQIIPADLNKKNFKAYSDAGSVTDFREFPNRSHFICGEPGWEEVASFVETWLRQNQLGGGNGSVGTATGTVI